MASEKLSAPRTPKALPPTTAGRVYFIFDDDDGFAEGLRLEDTVQALIAEEISETFVCVSVIDVLWPQMAADGVQDQILQPISSQVLVEEMEQVINVPKISYQDSSVERSDLSVPQIDELPKIVCVAESRQQTTEQTVDIPVHGSGVTRGVFIGPAPCWRNVGRIT